MDSRITNLGSHSDESTRIDMTRLDEATKAELLNEALPLLRKMKKPDSWEESKAINEAQLNIAIQEAEQRRKSEELERSGREQLHIYHTAGGLADTKRNKDLLVEHVQKNSGIFCAATVKAAVEGCRANLDWVKVVAAVAPTPTPTETETLVTLSDGSRQLSIQRPCPPNATVVQAKDYLARLRKQQQPNVPVVPGFKSALR